MNKNKIDGMMADALGVYGLDGVLGACADYVAHRHDCAPVDDKDRSDLAMLAEALRGLADAAKERGFR